MRTGAGLPGVMERSESDPCLLQAHSVGSADGKWFCSITSGSAVNLLWAACALVVPTESM